jgi:predicted ferric reductase
MNIPWNWSTMPWPSAACFALVGLLLICLMILVISAHRDPVQVELRAIRRKRRWERKLKVQMQQVIAERSRASRDCYRDIKGITR